MITVQGALIGILTRRFGARPVAVAGGLLMRSALGALPWCPSLFWAVAVLGGLAAGQGQRRDTWLTPELVGGLCGLHRLGFAHSVESWRGGKLVGGLYGISLGTFFCGESMFSERDASKVALIHLVERLRDWRFRMIDCQFHTDHLARFGAREWPRDRSLDELELARREPTRRGSWREDDAGAQG